MPRIRLPLCLLLLVLVLAACMAPGQRLLDVRVERDGQLVLTGINPVPDSWDEPTAWRRLNDVTLEAAGGIEAEADDAAKAVLKGKVRVVLVHGGRTFASADVDELRLVAEPGRPGSWGLAPGEVERTARVAAKGP